MAPKTRMPRYDIRNDGVGPYAVFYCDQCDREFRSAPNYGKTIAKDVAGDAVGGLLRKVPLFGGALADKATDDPRYSYDLNAQELDAAWGQVAERFHECPTCGQIVCPSCWDPQAGYCATDSPRRGEIARAEAEQAAGVIKGFASAFGFGEVVRNAAQAADTAMSQMARCPKDGTLAARGTKFCPECGSAMVQPASSACPNCGAEAAGAKFCPECGTKMPVAAAPDRCPKCGAPARGAKFCQECGTKIG